MLRYAPICAICAICAICERIESLWECAVAGAPVHAPLFAMLFCFFFAIVYSRAYAVSCAPVLGSITISVGSTSGSAGSCTPPPGWVGSPGTESRSRARSLVSRSQCFTFAVLAPVSRSARLGRISDRLGLDHESTTTNRTRKVDSPNSAVGDRRSPYGTRTEPKSLAEVTGATQDWSITFTIKPYMYAQALPAE